MTAGDMDEDDFYNPTSVKQFIINILTLCGIKEDLWTEEKQATLDTYIEDTSLHIMAVYLDSEKELKVQFSAPTQKVDYWAYFICAPGAIITLETFERVVQFGTERGDPLRVLLRDMEALHAPMVHASAWEKNIKDNYTNSMHSLLTYLTDEEHKNSGRTVLYIPMEGLQFSPEEAVKDRKLVQRMESVVIHWTDQVKKLLNEQEITKMSDSSGPLQEIDLWKSRSAQLLDISKQLQKAGVKHIQNILELSKSQYVQRFSKLADEIQSCSMQAQSNLSFLSFLKEPCEELTSLSPSKVPPKLQDIIHIIRVIWLRSKHYNSIERITGLYYKLSNQIVRICLENISLDRIFKGFVVSSKKTLTECIQCCTSWKEIYLQTVQAHKKKAPEPWDLDSSSIFVIVDTFVQRFKELVEVCDCQHQFARWEDGAQGPMPIFGGCQGPDFTRSYLDLEEKFHQGLQNLSSVGKGILDVKDTSWRYEFTRFGALIKDLEMTAQNLINSVFEPVNLVDEGVRLLDTFRPMSSREAIRRCIELKYEHVYSIFARELKLVNKEMNRTITSERHMPQVICRAYWIRSLRQRLHRPMEVLQKAYFMPESHTRKQMFAAHDQTVTLLDEMMRRCFTDWSQGLDGQYFTQLEQNLMVRSKDRSGRLDLNFDTGLWNLFSEAYHWERLKYEIPQSVSDIYRDRVDYMNLRERVLLLIRNYNSIIGMLSSSERELFYDRLDFLDRKIQPGLSKHTWLAKGTSKVFVQDCLNHVDKVHKVVEGYKLSIQSISNLCCEISETLLVRLDGKTVYRNLNFEDDQRAHRTRQLETLQSAHQQIVQIMTDVYEIFAQDGAAVQQQWCAYTEKVDNLIEEALRSNVKTSVQKLARAVNGDSKTSPNPLFRILVTLNQESSRSPPKVDFSPTLVKLAQLVNILPHLVETISGFERLPALLNLKSSQQTPIHVRIEQDEEIKKIQAAIATGMSSNASKLQSYLQTWDKESPPGTFDKDINGYKEKASIVQQEETVVIVRFVVLDCSPLKSALVQHCNEWQTKFTRLLSDIASSRLQELHESLHNDAKRLKLVPQTLEELSESLKLLDSLKKDLPNIDARIPVIQEQFALLDKYEEPLTQKVLDLREVMNEEWVWFQQVLIDSEATRQKDKEKFKKSLMNSSEEFKKKIQSSVEEFNSTGPFDSALSCETALQQIEKHRALLEALKQEENTLIEGLGFFTIEQPPSKTIIALEEDIDHLQQVWEITQDWNAKWNTWKCGSLPLCRRKHGERCTGHVQEPHQTAERTQGERLEHRVFLKEQD
ncbi:hypothetical protein WMY93_014044 [Mugilogobius chulae]|uniref:Dynein heavy chain tail domain-containing protein n=1 Tax=Mugilogobius chulae TaxID=88201 RepID=A0AAW0NXN0_9GOBI